MFRLFFLGFLAMLLAASAPAAAQERRAPGSDVQTLDRILPQIRNRYPGTFYDAQGPFPDETGAPHYRLKWMTPDGRVIWLYTDARTGHVLRVEHGGAQGAYPYQAPPFGYPAPRRNFGGYGFPPGSYYGAPRGGYWNGHGGAPRGWGGHDGHDHHGG